MAGRLVVLEVGKQVGPEAGRQVGLVAGRQVGLVASKLVGPAANMRVDPDFQEHLPVAHSKVSGRMNPEPFRYRSESEVLCCHNMQTKPSESPA